MFEAVVLTVVPELVPCHYNFLLQYVSSEKQERVKHFRDFQAAQNCLLGDILARIEICRVTGFSNKQLEFATNSYGKPYLTNASHVYYNISHAGSYITCVVADEPVGIDVEIIRSVDLKIAERFFSTRETAYVLSASDSVQLQRFFEIWTKKESRIKWSGKGLSKDLRSFNVLDFSSQPKVFYHQIYDSEKAICYVCSSKRETPTVRVINTSTLLQLVHLLNK